jgi:sporadic carbohydrate cluster 2OG-Fe(II) oxygenase
MPLIDSFSDQDDLALEAEFLELGYVLKDVGDLDTLTKFRRALVEAACEFLDRPAPNDDEKFLNDLHHIVGSGEINDLRLACFNALNRFIWCRPTYYEMAKPWLHRLVGSELAMQNKVNLSIQMPGDETSVLPAHTDVWSAETPFEVVQWLPLVDVFDTKAMFILPPEKNREVRKFVSAHGNAPDGLDLYAGFKDEFRFLEIPFGKVLIFSPILLHGNILNETSETRWSLNSRFTGLFTPYASDEKTLGNFFLPITPRPVSRVGMNFEAPGEFDE